ncbi:acyclic terpene utilization AtuA family protein [Brevibacterium album]|uniref:acyclic terpene utilization AtuA family protein n=1 Tax=Brevibacterium album TaxID=417948 RepID=UPI00040CCA16|nr:acyclic terpene utilization AtuA family protein [Brevibacterium album]
MTSHPDQAQATGRRTGQVQRQDSAPRSGDRQSESRPLRVGNVSGFYGDRLSAWEEMVEAGVEVLTGDYLAELTMLILARQKAKDPRAGYARTFAAQLRGALQRIVAAGTRVVANAGGMNPQALAPLIREQAAEAGFDVPVAWVDGDDLTDRSEELGLGSPLAANAYLGGWGITEALRGGAQVVVTGRVTDAALTTGPAAWFHGWDRDDHDALAGAMAAGHVIECGMQATGGNFSFFREIADLRRPGFPIAEIAADGSSVITKPAGTGGAVTAETVLSQLLYEVGGARYAGPDATLRLDSIRLTDLGEDRVRISGVRGEAPPPELKVSVTEVGGFRQEIVFQLTGLDAEAKAELIRSQFEFGLEAAGLPRPAQMAWNLARSDRPDAVQQEEATARLTLVARDPDPKTVGRSFANVPVEFALGSVPGYFTGAPPGEASVYGRFRPESVPQDVPVHTVHLPDGTEAVIDPPADTRALAPTELDLSSAGSPEAAEAGSVESSRDTGAEPASAATGNGSGAHTGAGLGGGDSAHAGTVRVPLGHLAGGRSGDKGGSANIGLWARTDAVWQWLRAELTPARLRALLPETADLDIDRVELAGLRALNFTVHGLLGEGVAYRARFDPQAKGLAEWLRSRCVDVPADLVRSTAGGESGAPAGPAAPVAPAGPASGDSHGAAAGDPAAETTGPLPLDDFFTQEGTAQ